MTTAPKFDVRSGEEFRDDGRGKNALPAALIKELSRQNDAKAWRSVLSLYAVLAATMAVAMIWWNPWVVVPAIIIMASRQQACFVLAHDAAHYRLFEDRTLNDLIGRILATPVGISMRTYRVVHRLHHNHLYGPQDPDIPLHGGYPRGRRYLILWILPLCTVLQALLRFRAICEHGAVRDQSSPLLAVRTNLGPGWLRWFLFPYQVNYHIEHHLYPAVPHYNLPACHRELKHRGILEGTEVRHIFTTAGLVVADPA